MLKGATVSVAYSLLGSAFGQKIDIAAPREITSLQLGNATGFASGTGNSFATPLVAGAAGLVLANDPSLSHNATKLKSRLLCNASKQIVLDTTKVNGGRFLDAFAAVTNASNCP